AIAAEVECLARFQNLVGIRQLYDPSVESVRPAPLELVTAAIKLDLISVVHVLPMENQQAGERLRGHFRSSAERGLRSAVRHENYVFRVEHRVRRFPRQDLSQVKRCLLPFTTLLVGADDSRFGLRSRTSEDLAQGQRLQDGNLFVRFQGESAWFSNLANHVNNPGAGNLDDVAGMNQGIAARISGLEKVSQVDLHGIFGCGSIAVEARGQRLCVDSILRAGRGLSR